MDGIVGNQTWAALREAEPREPSTDGREPHTFVESGPEARWATEDSEVVRYDHDADELWLMLLSVGDDEGAKIPDYEATVRVTANGESDVSALKIALRLPSQQTATRLRTW